MQIGKKRNRAFLFPPSRKTSQLFHREKELLVPHLYAPSLNL